MKVKKIGSWIVMGAQVTTLLTVSGGKKTETLSSLSFSLILEDK